MTAWRRHTVDAARLELDVLEGPPLVDEPGQLVQAAAPLVLGVRYGEAATIEGWRGLFAQWPPAAFGPVTAVGAARRLEARVEAAWAEGVFEGCRHERFEEPARTVVALAFEDRPVPVLAYWSVPTDLRGDHADDERHFFAALRVA